MASVIIGTACLVRFEGAWLFELQKSHKWRHGDGGAPIIGIGCIGGRLEVGETPREALFREAMEEIGCAVELRAPSARVAVDPRGAIRDLAHDEGDPWASLYWEEERPGFMPGARVAVFYGKPQGIPWPVDLPAILAMPASALPILWSGGGTIQQFIEMGCRLRERIPIPWDARLEPVGTVAVLGRVNQSLPQLVERLLG